ncbi:hypothetical protein Tco_0260429 [Tanacetum coccineum]
MVSFRQLHSHLKLLSNNDLKGTRTESGFKRAFATLFGQDVETFIGTMFLNVDQLEKQLDNEEFQEIGSMAAFKVLETQFQTFIRSRNYLDDEYVVMTRNYFLQYTQLAIPEFRDTLIQHMESVKKSIDERAQHKQEYDSWVNERLMQTTEEKVDSSKALDASLVDTESSGTESKEQDTSSRSGNDAHADDADIRHIYDEEPMAEVQTTAEINIFATGQQHTEQPEFNNEGEVDQNAEQCHDKCPLPAKLTDNHITEHSYQSLESENVFLKEGQHGQFSKIKSNEAKVKHDIDVIETINIELEHKVAKLLKENETLKRHYKEMFDSIKTTRAKNIEHTTSLIANNDNFKAQLHEKGFAITALKNVLRKLTGNSENTKFAKSSILGKPVLQPHRNQSVVRQPTAFKYERPRSSRPRFAYQVDVNNDLSKPTHYLPKEKESAVAKPHHMIAPGSSRYSSNDMVHTHYLEEAKQKTQESSRNLEPSKPTGRIFKTVSLRWVPIGKIFASSINKVDNEPPNGSNEDITNPYECKQTIDVSAGTLNLSAAMTFDHNSLELRIHDHNNEPSSSKLVPKVVPSADKTATSRQELELLFHHHITLLRSTCGKMNEFKGIMPTKIELTLEQSQQGVSNDVLDSYKDGDGDASFQLKSDSLPHAHAQTTKTYYKHQDSRIKKAQVLKTKTSANSDKQDLPLRYQVYQGRLLASFQDDAKYEHVGQDTRSQGGKDDQD